ncbi:PREDICTED: phosphatidate cytidylyltransferase, mitochondrial isoform X3 [Nelumbo nucifera]|uniref:Phosphatidate cytidylyltransferase, mitochondrial n=1 Tax=Nelumbo nucifera TaxID=4432 RepID=A0A1U8A347_NELNU|nr:PREDICTED: phosphatidate cytidylyltransferase, mitochondrial isoform X3 [Nelumbo nucifera]
MFECSSRKMGSGVEQKMENGEELASLLDVLPRVEFCCVYGSSLLTNSHDKKTMVDYILGVSDPMQWHSENLEMNKDHYASWMVHLGGSKLITEVADEIGVGVHFNPFVSWNDRMIKYGVVRMHDLVQDILNWERFYFSGRLQKPVHILVDNLDIRNVNSVNLKAAMSAALLLLPPKFTEVELYARICSLSYMGDLRMLFAEDRNKVQKIVKGQFNLFHSMYKPFLDDYAAKDLLRFSSWSDNHGIIIQTGTCIYHIIAYYRSPLRIMIRMVLLPYHSLLKDYGLSAAGSFVSSLPQTVRTRMGMKLGEKRKLAESGRTINEVVINSREEAAECMRKVVRRIVMVSSARQAIAGLLAAGGVNAVRYLARKMVKDWSSFSQDTSVTCSVIASFFFIGM